jgi:protein O-mannosyl-transferase
VTTRGSHVRTLLVAAALVLAVLAVYGRSASHRFVDLDDGEYVYDNVMVTQGLTPPGIAWAFALSSYANWHPVTWLSHMTDVQVFGLDPGGHHLTSVALHAANAALLFALLLDLTGATWRSALVAALFALHPLHVESVAWVSERKDVLSTLFWLLTMLGYARFVRRGGAARYAWVVVAFALGLMSKAMLVTLPLVLLLVDFWPLDRLVDPDDPARPLRVRDRLPALVVEKLPLFALAAVFSVIAYVAQHSWGATASLDSFPLGARVANAVVSYAAYLGKTVVPVGLAAFYPHPASVGEPVPLARLAVALVVLAAISIVSLAQWRRRPWLAVGWLWYLVTLLPVIGVVQIGAQALADRYTYVPLVGIFVMLAWSIPPSVERSRPLRLATGAVCAAVLVVLAALSTVQVGYWRDGVTLYTHAIAVTEKNWLAWNNLGMQRLGAGQFDAALDSFAHAVRIKPDYADGWYNEGVALGRLGRPAEAVRAYRYSLHLDPANADGWTNLGIIEQSAGHYQSAIGAYRAALGLRGTDVAVLESLALAYAAQGDLANAATTTEQLRWLDPQRSEAVRARILQTLRPAPAPR